MTSLLEQFKHLTDEIGQSIDDEGFKRLLRHLYPNEETGDRIQNFSNLCEELGKKGRLSSDDVDEFYEALESCELNEATRLLRKYVRNTGVKSKVECDPLEDDLYDLKIDDDNSMCDVHDEMKELLCNTCNEKICYGCVYEEHRDHQILTEEDIQGKIESEKGEIKELISKLQSGVNQVESYLQNVGASNREIIERQFQEQYEIWCSMVDNREIELLRKLDAHMGNTSSSDESMQAKIDSSLTELDAIRAKLERQQPDAEKAGYQFKQLKTWEDKIDKINERLNSEMKSSDDSSHVHLSFQPISNDGRFVNFQSGTVIGAISVSDQAAVLVRDERCYFKGVTLTCMSSVDGTPFFTDFPVVISGSLYVLGVGKPRILIASGRKLAVIVITREEFICAINETKMMELHIPDKSYVTGLTTIQSGSHDTGLLVAENRSTKMHRLAIDLEPFDILDCSMCLHSIFALACVDNTAAVIDSVRNEVVMVSGDGIMAMSGKLHPPEAIKAPSRPACIQWDGTFWTIIWETIAHGEEGGPNWRQVIYKKDGDVFPSDGASGSCPVNTEVASISFLRNQSLICFSDGKLRLFPTYCE